MRRFEKFEKEDIMKNEKRPSEYKKAKYLLPQKKTVQKRLTNLFYIRVKQLSYQNYNLINRLRKFKIPTPAVSFDPFDIESIVY